MSIKHNQLTTLPNPIITDIRVTDTAFRIYCYLISKPDQWEVSNEEIQKHLNIKINDEITAAWANLIETGWISYDGDFIYMLSDLEKGDK